MRRPSPTSTQLVIASNTTLGGSQSRSSAPVIQHLLYYFSAKPWTNKYTRFPVGSFAQQQLLHRPCAPTRYHGRPGVWGIPSLLWPNASTHSSTGQMLHVSPTVQLFRFCRLFSFVFDPQFSSRHHAVRGSSQFRRSAVLVRVRDTVRQSGAEDCWRNVNNRGSISCARYWLRSRHGVQKAPRKEKKKVARNPQNSSK